MSTSLGARTGSLVLALALSLAATARAADPGAFGTKAASPGKKGKIDTTSKPAAPALTEEQQRLAGALLGLEPRTVELDLVKKLVPRSWRIEVSGLPDGVVAIASGPEGDDRAAVLVSRAPEVIDAALLGRRGARDALTASLDALLPGATITATRAEGLLGGIELTGEGRRDGAVITLVHAFTRGPGGYVVTLAAPAARIRALRARVEAFVGGRALGRPSP